MNMINVFGTGCNLEGIAKSNGKIVFVPYALVGENIEVISSKYNSKFETVNDFKLIAKSEKRCVPKCKYYGKCGGCQIQHTFYSNELDLKQQIIKNNFSKFNIDANIMPVVASKNEYNYRNKITLFTEDGNLCLKDINGNNIPINRCEIVDEKINIIFPIIKDFLLNLKILNTFVKSVIIRYIENKYLILFVVSKKINFDFFIRSLLNKKINFGLFYCINNKPNSNLISSDYNYEYGLKSIELKENNIDYQINPYSFLQVNNDIKSKLYEEALKHINSSDIVADCYAGSGLLSALISKKARHVYAIEIDLLASQICENLARKNNIKNLTTINGDCKTEIANLCKSKKIDIVVLDPPRKGCDKKVIDAIANQKTIKKIIYISCNSATLCRDLQILKKSALFKIVLAMPFDMFPKTSNIETLVVLEKL